MRSVARQAHDHVRAGGHVGAHPAGKVCPSHRDQRVVFRVGLVFRGGVSQRKYGIGKIHCQTAGFGGAQGSKAELVLMGIRDLERIKNEISAHFMKKP